MLTEAKKVAFANRYLIGKKEHTDEEQVLCNIQILEMGCVNLASAFIFTAKSAPSALYIALQPQEKIVVVQKDGEQELYVALSHGATAWEYDAGVVVERDGVNIIQGSSMSRGKIIYGEEILRSLLTRSLSTEKQIHHRYRAG